MGKILFMKRNLRVAEKLQPGPAQTKLFAFPVVDEKEKICEIHGSYSGNRCSACWLDEPERKEE